MIIKKDEFVPVNDCIDLMKFICAILVVVIHVAPIDAEFNLFNWWIQQYLARIAVPFFFCASGFFLFKKIKIETFDINVILQYVKRMIRLYIIWSVIYLPFNIYDIMKSDDIMHSLLVLGRNTIFAGSYLHLWYLTASAFAVLLIGFLLSKKVKLCRIFVVSLFFYLVGLLGDSYFGILKLLQPFTPIWEGLKTIEKVICSTRNGLFFGFLFITMGVVLSYRDKKNSTKNSIIGFLASMLFMLVEATLVKWFDFALGGSNMYICLIPATWFLFCLVSNIELKNSGVWITLRHMSSLVFYIHLWVAKIVKIFLIIVFDYDIVGKGYHFILTTGVSVLLAYIILRLSEYDKFKWLKRGYL